MSDFKVNDYVIAKQDCMTMAYNRRIISKGEMFKITLLDDGEDYDIFIRDMRTLNGWWVKSSDFEKVVKE